MFTQESDKDFQSESHQRPESKHQAESECEVSVVSKMCLESNKVMTSGKSTSLMHHSQWHSLYVSQQYSILLVHILTCQQSINIIYPDRVTTAAKQRPCWDEWRAMYSYRVKTTGTYCWQSCKICVWGKLHHKSEEYMYMCRPCCIQDSTGLLQHKHSSYRLISLEIVNRRWVLPN